MKKLFTGMIVALLTVMILPQGHVHDEECGYDPETKTGCIYEEETVPGIDLFQHKWHDD